MPRVKKSEEIKKEEKTSNKKLDKEVDTSSSKSSFTFGNIKPMSKEERANIINEATSVKPNNNPVVSWTVEETDYKPEEWVVVIDTKGNIYKEPVPRYCNYDNFIIMLTTIPDVPQSTGGRISINADALYRTKFPVKNIECYINTVAYDGTRSKNEYALNFDIENKTRNIGGNIVFASPNKGFTLKQANSVVEEIIKTLEKSIKIDI